MLDSTHQHIGPHGQDGIALPLLRQTSLPIDVPSSVSDVASPPDAEPETESPPSGKQDASRLDPEKEARRWLTSLTQDGTPRLRFRSGEWLRWAAGAWRRKDAADVQGELVAFTSKRWSQLNRGIVANVVMHVQSQAALPDDVTAPAWVGEPHLDWQAKDCLATATQVVHLPSAAAGHPCTIPATPRFFTESALDYEFDPKAPAPARWLSLLEENWPGDRETHDALGEWFAYMLGRSTRYQKMALLIGPTGCGKGTILRVMRRLVGERNHVPFSADSLAETFGLEDFIGKTLAVWPDARFPARGMHPRALERMLRISGEDSVEVNRKKLKVTGHQLGTRLVIASNVLPEFNDDAAALVARILAFEFTHSVRGTNAEDAGLGDKLNDEIAGILNWAIEGWQRLHLRGGFIQPTSGRRILAEIRLRSAPVAAFVRQCCELVPDAFESIERLYQAYVRWSDDAGLTAKDVQRFGSAVRVACPTLADHRPRLRNGSRPRGYLGIRLRGLE